MVAQQSHAAEYVYVVFQGALSMCDGDDTHVEYMDKVASPFEVQASSPSSRVNTAASSSSSRENGARIIPREYSKDSAERSGMLDTLTVQEQPIHSRVRERISTLGPGKLLSIPKTWRKHIPRERFQKNTVVSVCRGDVACWRVSCSPFSKSLGL